ncbi:tumor protein p53-inducible protein 13 [Conger conger]|uniref:tumor protein p53-inducible protein 13 n=1 Tax=Conger conger TaxID=82655 RepID=UPI002A59CCAE|nr:tumor protein p53-inducible protein 13 [Conger conger]
MNSAGWRRWAHLMVKQLTLCFSLFLCWVDASMWPHCDNGKLWLEKDLPRSAVYRCAGASWSESTQKLPSIDTKHPLQPAMSVCMQTPITYNHTIPSSGAHRPVGAQSGEYLFCPPQRWLHNLQHGATVFLYHPCAPASERVRLSVLAHSCLSDYVITPHYELGANRPLAMASWGRTLELSHVTESEVCGWLDANAANRFGGRKLQKEQRREYRLYLTRPAGVSRLTESGERGAQKPLAVLEEQQAREQSVKRCCEGALSRLWEGDSEMDRWKKKRRRRAIFRSSEGQGEKREETYKDGVNSEAASHSEPNGTGPERVPAHRPVRPPGRAAGTSGKPGQAMTGRGAVNKERNTELKQREEGAVEKIPEGDSGGQREDGETSRKTHDRQRDSQTLGAVQGRGEGGEKPEKRETSRDHGYGGDANTVSEPHGGNGRPKPKQQTQDPEGQPDGSRARQRDPGCCGCTGAPAERAVLEQRLHTQRTDEAVWAAAALGFLLVLLALSVLHTRLYRHWRTMPSLYWYHPQHDYDSVADVVRRRLKMSGGKKRRAPQSRRQECVLLPSSSTEDESE